MTLLWEDDPFKDFYYFITLTPQRLSSMTRRGHQLQLVFSLFILLIHHLSIYHKTIVIPPASTQFIVV